MKENGTANFAVETVLEGNVRLKSKERAAVTRKVETAELVILGMSCSIVTLSCACQLRWKQLCV